MAASVSFLLWFHRVHRNLQALGSFDLQYSPRWAVLSFIIPIINMWWPYRVAKEIWKASDPNVTDAKAWKSAPSSHLLGIWWVAFVISNALGRIVMRTNPDPQTIPQLLNNGWLNLVSSVVDVIGMALAIMVVRAIDARQEEKRRRSILASGGLPQLP